MEGNPGDAGEEPGSAPQGNDCFDASQYAFFGKGDLEEVELGGLEDEDEGDTCLGGIDSDELQYSSFQHREDEGLRSSSHLDDFTSAFSKLNQDGGGPGNAVFLCNSGSYSRESSTGNLQNQNSSEWTNQGLFDAEIVQEDRRWWSQPQPPSAYPLEPNALCRTSSYPHQQPQKQSSISEPIPVPRPSFPSFPPHDGRSQAYLSLLQNSNFPPKTSGGPMPLSDFSQFSASPHHMLGLLNRDHFGGNISQFNPPGLSPEFHQQGHAFNQTNGLGEQLQNLPGSIPQQFHHRNGIIHPQMPQHLQRRMQSHQQSPPHLSYMQSQSSSLSPPQIMNKFELHGMGIVKDPRQRLLQRPRQNFQFPQQNYDASRNNFRWPQFRSKHMSSEEIENIMRMQHAATHSNDPYVDDYYHQACLAKMTAGTGLKHHFCPISLRDLSSRTHANSDPHAYLQVDALGRLPFSSIRRPRPLLDVESPSADNDDDPEHKSSLKPLDQEPLLAARITIEDGLCLLLNVNDIDRLLEFSQPQDGGYQLRRQRQVLLEGLATSLQLVDPLAPGKAGQYSSNDDIIFLRLASLPKGLKLLSRYLQLLLPGNELTRVVCMAIFRHLRFLFGGSQVTDITRNLSRIVSSCVFNMDLNGLSACLAAIVCSSEQPPLRPLGSSVGDEATVLIISVLKRATELLTDPQAANHCNTSIRTVWQASFDSLFRVLINHCLSKYDIIMQTLQLQADNNATLTPVAANAISREIPIDLLRASLPHTNENQRKFLLDFAQRSMSASGFIAQGDGGNSG